VRDRTFIAVAAATVLVGLFAISGQSLWIDEGTAALMISRPTLAETWNALRGENSSNLQLPLQLLYLWVWVHLFGNSEYVLRASNIPWLLVALGSLWYAWARQVSRFLWMSAVLLLSPFVWFYMDEARPYMALFACTCVLLAVVIRSYHFPEECGRDKRWYFLFCITPFFVCAASATAIPFAGMMMIGAALLLTPRRLIECVRRSPFITILSLAAYCALAAYLVWTLQSGARASAVGRTTLVNLLFVCYEQAGFAGLGPGRVAVREEGIAAFRPFILPLAVAAAAFIPVVLGVIGAIRAANPRKVVLYAVLLVAIPTAVVLAAAWP
jgi:hypothetical protein